MISYALFLFACLIPPSVYSHYMKEPDLMFLDPATILFYSLCVASFMAGVWLVGWIFPSSFVERKLKTRISPTLFLLIPLALGIAATAIAMFLLVKQVPDIILLLLSQQGAGIKDALAFDIKGRFTVPPIMLTGITWWAFWRYSALHLGGWRKRLVKFALFVAVLSVIASSTLIVSRNYLMQIVCGMAILYVLRRTLKRQISATFYIKTGMTLAICVSLLFMSFSFLRGTDTWDDQFYSLFGYTVASYNRLAALVNGSLHYPLGGRGIYLSSVASHTRLLPFKSILNTPDTVEAWGAEFGAVTQAGLDGNLIWSGTFGYIFADLGWLSLPFIFGYGLLYGIVWRWMKRGSPWGLVLYPCFAFCELFWLGTNYLLDAPLEALLVVAICFAGYESLFLLSPVEGMATKSSNRQRMSSLLRPKSLQPPPDISEILQ